ncbi:Arc family DNA-binding protein [Variovorax sp. KK3]|uniref:Arc family DNA-binding protein n=1 Tax=Variovorax sp. KK3 TaxID=1855728 RepID=UPI001C4E02A6|nr:Arc family DNA-binding protein [Variovorax sp. KK3]
MPLAVLSSSVFKPSFVALFFDSSSPGRVTSSNVPAYLIHVKRHIRCAFLVLEFFSNEGLCRFELLLGQMRGPDAARLNMSRARTPQTEDKYIVRLPDGMRERLKSFAATNHRTLNAEIVRRLELSLEERQTEKADLRALEQQVELQKALTAQFQLIGDCMDDLRSIAAGLLLEVLNAERASRRAATARSALTSELTRWIAQRSDRGAAASLLKLIESANPAVLDSLRSIACRGLPRGPAVDKHSPRSKNARS